MKKSTSDAAKLNQKARGQSPHVSEEGASVAGIGGLASTLPLSPVFAQAKKVVAIMPGVFMPEPGATDCRTIIRSHGGERTLCLTDRHAGKIDGAGRHQKLRHDDQSDPVRERPGIGQQGRRRTPTCARYEQNTQCPEPDAVVKKDIVTRAGKTYMVPVVWGYDSVVYNADKIPTDDPLTQSWGVLFDDKYKGKVAWRDDAHGMIMAAALHRGHPDPVAMDANDLNEITAYLIDRKKNVRTMWSKSAKR